MSKISVGDVYRHIGGGGVPATGLRLRVERLDSDRGGFWASYPGHPGKGNAFYRGFTLGQRYVLETVAACPRCGGDATDQWFDRSLCPCSDAMHTRCRNCGAALDGCAFETDDSASCVASGLSEREASGEGNESDREAENSQSRSAGE